MMNDTGIDILFSAFRFISARLAPRLETPVGSCTVSSMVGLVERLRRFDFISVIVIFIRNPA